MKAEVKAQHSTINISLDAEQEEIRVTYYDKVYNAMPVLKVLLEDHGRPQLFRLLLKSLLKIDKNRYQNSGIPKDQAFKERRYFVKCLIVAIKKGLKPNQCKS